MSGHIDEDVISILFMSGISEELTLKCKHLKKNLTRKIFILSQNVKDTFIRIILDRSCICDHSTESERSGTVNTPTLGQSSLSSHFAR